jgi:alcohol dehydrogenase class IV
MVNFRKLSARAEKAKDLIDKQGGSDALKNKAERIKGIARGGGSVSDRAKAAAEVAREKPKPEDPAR